MTTPVIIGNATLYLGDCRRIAYLPPSLQAQTVHIRPHDDPSPPANGGKSGKTFAQFPFSVAVSEVIRG